MSESVDCLSEKGRKIGTTTKETAHKKGTLHKAVHVFVLNEKKELFLQKRSKQMLLQPGKWDTSCAGHVKKGESNEKAARRELKEELGIAPKKLERLGQMRHEDKTKRYWNRELITVYRTEWNGRIKRNSESSDGKWVSMREAKKISRTKKACPLMGILLKRFFN